MTYSRRDTGPSPYAACSTNGEPRNVINQTSQSLPPFALLAVSKTLMEIVEVGGLMSYGSNIADAWRQAALIPAASSRVISQRSCQSYRR
ncbi:MAG: hypothetical protein WB839_09610, partial [Pseudolabrys sp.]